MESIPPRKHCPKCGQDKPRSDFGNNRARSDGLQSYCKTCFSTLDSRRNRTMGRKSRRNELKREKRIPARIAREAAHAAERESLRAAPTKVCAKCEQEKPKASYTVDDRYVDGCYPYCAECRKEWRAERKQRIYELNKAWRATYPDRVRKLGRSSYYRTRDTPAFQHRRRIRDGIQWQRKRDRERGVEHHLTYQEWREILCEQDHTCLMCGRIFDDTLMPTRDHIDPKKGLSKDNCQALCGSCNSSKGAKYIDLRHPR